MSKRTQGTSEYKIKASVKPPTQSAGRGTAKRIIVDVDYNPRQDYALRALAKKLKQIV